MATATAIALPLRQIEHFWDRVIPNGDCWEWTGRLNGSGYGYLEAGGSRIVAHRLAYLLLVGPIPSGKELDHLCRNKRCVNPDHNEPVTHSINVLRGASPGVHRAMRVTHCKRGHQYDDRNTYTDPRGLRRCRPCAAAYQRERSLRVAA